MTVTWRDLFDEQDQTEIRFNETYFRDFHHRTDGANIRRLVAQMATLLDEHWKLDAPEVTEHEETAG